MISVEAMPTRRQGSANHPRRSKRGEAAHRDARADDEADELWAGADFYGRNAQHHEGGHKREGYLSNGDAAPVVFADSSQGEGLL